MSIKVGLITSVSILQVMSFYLTLWLFGLSKEGRYQMLLPSTLLSFLGASIILTLSPGPDNIYVLSAGVSKGTRVALFSAWGMVSGVSLHTFAAAVGLSAIIYSYAPVFLLLKVLGAVYLFYLAILTYRGRNDSYDLNGKQYASGWGAYKKGFLMNILNPKVGLFFIAFLPQFVDPTDEHRIELMIILGLVFMLQAFVLFSLVAFFSDKLGKTLRDDSRVGCWLSVGASSVFVLFGAKLLLDF